MNLLLPVLTSHMLPCMFNVNSMHGHAVFRLESHCPCMEAKISKKLNYLRKSFTKPSEVPNEKPLPCQCISWQALYLLDHAWKCMGRQLRRENEISVSHVTVIKNLDSKSCVNWADQSKRLKLFSCY